MRKEFNFGWTHVSLMLILGIFTWACSSKKDISVAQFRQHLASSDVTVILDTRSRREFDVSRLEGAQFIGYEEFSLELLPKTLHKEDTIVLYCSVGYRSGKIRDRLAEAGYRNAYNLQGGIFDWVIMVLHSASMPIIGYGE